MIAKVEPQPIEMAIVIPCYKEKEHILQVLSDIPHGVSKIYCVDDACPAGTGKHVQENCTDPRVTVLFNEVNSGVGGAVITGYKQALEDKMDIVVKIDGDGQMNPALLPELLAPIVTGRADYTKGNRFYQLDYLEKMPIGRIMGNAGLSFLTKLSSGYWNIFDPTNGFTAIHVSALKLLPLDKISKRYFFESDMLFRLGTIRAVVQDVPQRSIYGQETSHMNVLTTIPHFAYKHCINIFKRVFYNYFLRDFNVASLEILIGPPMFLYGLVYGFWTWVENNRLQEATPTGTIMVIALSLIMGMQLILSALQFDLNNQPKVPLQSTNKDVV